MSEWDEIAAPALYLGLRSRLIKYLRRLGSRTADDHADEAILRLLQKSRAGEIIQDVRAYCVGIARNVYLESTREPPTTPLANDIEYRQRVIEAEDLDQCLSRCLKSLPYKERRILMMYQRGTGPNLIENRRQQAEKLGITLDALRIQVHRIRKRLGHCVRGCSERIGEFK